MLTTVFIGSSTEGLGLAKNIHSALLDEGYSVLLWKDAFKPSLFTLETIEALPSERDFAILVLTPDDLMTRRGIEISVTRDNVILELGFFFGSVGRERTIVVLDQPDTVTVPTDLAGLTTIIHKQRDGQEIKSTSRAVATEIHHHLENVSDRYRMQNMMINAAKVENNPCEALIKRLEDLDDLGDRMLTSSDIDIIAAIVSHLSFIEKAGLGSKQFNIVFGEESTRRLDIYDFLCAVKQMDLLLLSECVVGLKELRFHIQGGSPIVLASDLFARNIPDNERELQSMLRTSEKVVYIHPNNDDLNRYLSGNPTTVIRHRDWFPPRTSLDVHELQLPSIMNSMCNYGIRIHSEGIALSTVHVVMSHFRREPTPFMIITSTHTRKELLQAILETPIVMEEKSELIYYGDKEKPPSFESVPHWIIHDGMANVGLKDSYILHIHIQSMLQLAEEFDDVVTLDAEDQIAIVGYESYGTEKSGRTLLSMLLDREDRAVVMRRHGLWFVGQSLTSLVEKSIRIAKKAEGVLESLSVRPNGD
jgi:ribulose-5-phosphate 4-epimerase/fuculose-1-phosphate aldolase